MENYTRENDLNGIRSIGDCQETLDILCVEEFSQLLESKSRKCQHRSPIRWQMRRVPQQIRQKRPYLYDPVVVSLGPYHHGKPELQQAEEFKYVCLDLYASGSEEKKCFFFNKVLQKIDVIRGCYAEISLVEKYDDRALAMMMLLDACYIVSFMENYTGHERNNEKDWNNRLGTAAAHPFTIGDIILLENQIPFQVVQLLISLQYEKEIAQELLHLFVGSLLGKGRKAIAGIPGEDKEPPLHLLEALWRVIVGKSNNEANQKLPSSKPVSRFLVRRKKKDENTPWSTYNKYLSVTDLKAKGIHFRPSSSYSLKDIRFKSHAFHGEIQLPIRTISDRTKVFLSNMIAYELSPDTNAELTVLSYINFMKSLIASPEDVKELQEKQIFYNMFASHEQVVKVFEEIDTFGLVNYDVFDEVKQQIGEHCSSKAKTWIADLINTRFQSPWTALALFAATFLLCLTFLQTYFTIRPVN